MKIICTENYEKMSQCASKIVLNELKKKRCLLGLATGSTPEGLYFELAKAYREKRADFSNVTTVNLDEYVSLPPEHEESYRYFMEKHLFEKIEIDRARTHLPSGIGEPFSECEKYDRLLRDLGRIDLQILGLGLNGHIGFNEPSDFFEKDTHVVSLSESTIEANSRFFQNREEVPRRAITMGIRPIMQAKKVLILVSGKKKAEIAKRAFLGEVTPQVPASILQLHPNAIVIGDRDALSGIMA